MKAEDLFHLGIVADDSEATREEFTALLGYEWGPEVEEHELAILREKLAYLSRGAEFIVFSGSLPRGVDARPARSPPPRPDPLRV